MNSINKIYGFIKNIMLDIFFLAGWYRPALRSSEENFKKAVNLHWNKAIWSERKNSYLLVEGYLCDYGPNYLYRLALLSKAVNQKKALRPLIIYQDYLHRHTFSVSVFESLGIRDFFSTAIDFRSRYLKLKSKLIIKNIIGELKTGKDLIDFKFNGVVVGDLIYDTILSKLKKYKTIDKIESDMHIFIQNGVYEILMYESLFKRFNISQVLMTHTAYLNYGTLCRLALKFNKEVILTTDIDVTVLKPQQFATHLPVYHEYIRNFVVERITQFSNPQLEIENSKSYLEDRFRGKIDQVDVQLAYKDRSLYSRDKFKLQLGLDDKPIVFIFSHIFSDSPHSTQFQIYNDTYDWIVETLKVCSEVSSVNWIIKPHPAAKLYEEEGVVENLIRNLNAKHIHLAPADLNTASITDIAHAVVTVTGTAGLEFTCMGIPVVLAGKPFYANEKFRNCPRTKNEYAEILKNIITISKVSNEEIENAMLMLAAFRHFSITNNLVLDSDLLMRVWGYKDRDINFVISEMGKRLENVKPENEPQFLKVIDLLN